MAQNKKPTPFQRRPPEQIEEDDSSSSEEESEESESDDEEKQEEPATPPPSRIPQNQTQAKKIKIADTQTTPPPSTQPLLDNDEGSGSEDESSPSSPSASDFTIKVNSPKKLTFEDSKPALKRPAESKSDESILRGMKRAKVGDGDTKKAKPVGRVCSEEDEVRILIGMIDYHKEKDADPSADMGAFLEFVKGNLQAEMTRTQLYEKVRRLRNKYFKNVERIEKGDNVDFSKPHETQTFNLSKKIWGSGGMTRNGSEKKNDNGRSDDENMKKSSESGNLAPSPKKPKKFEKKNVVQNGEAKDGDSSDCDGLNGEDFEKKYPYTIQAFTSLGRANLMTAEQVVLLKANLNVVGSATSVEFEQKCKELQVEETEFLLKKFQMFADHTRRVLEAMKK